MTIPYPFPLMIDQCIESLHKIKDQLLDDHDEATLTYTWQFITGIAKELEGAVQVLRDGSGEG